MPPALCGSRLLNLACERSSTIGYYWSYAQAEQWVSDSLVLRQFCRVYAARVPDATTLLRWANLIQPDTLQQLLEHVITLARQNRVTRGRKLRLDSTVVATNIHYPVDSMLLGDGVHLLTRASPAAKIPATFVSIVAVVAIKPCSCNATLPQPYFALAATQ